MNCSAPTTTRKATTMTTTPNTDVIAAAYERGMTVPQIAEHFGITATDARDLLGVLYDEPATARQVEDALSQHRYNDAIAKAHAAGWELCAIVVAGIVFAIAMGWL